MGEILPQIVKRLREQARLSQGELAKRSELSKSMISKIEQDKTSPVIRSKTLGKLANGLGLSTDSPDRRLLFEAAWEREERERAKTSDLLRLLEAIPHTPPPHKPPKDGVASEPQVLTRMEDIADCVISMLNHTQELRDKGEAEVLVTTQGRSSIFLQLGRADDWYTAINEVMQRKWNVVSLYRLTGDMNRAVEVIQEIRHLGIWPEQYTARVFQRVGELRPTYNLLVVPQVGALLAFSTHNPDVIDGAFFYPHPKCDEYIALLTHHFNLLFIETVKLARTFKRRSLEWEDTLTATCQIEADELLANNCVELWNLPPALYDEFLEESLRRENAYSPMEFRRLKAHHTQRRDSFERNVKHCTYRTLLPKRSVKDALGLITGECRYIVLYANLPNQYITVQDKEQAFKHIQNLIDDLKNYDNYEVALIDEKHEYEKYILLTPWLVKGETAVLTAIYTKGEDGQGEIFASELEITEPGIVRSYRQQFLDIWGEVAGKDKLKHKENVIRELTHLLDEAKRKGETSRT
jgi:transcriptional regulator with XRE-family HTH domain